MRTKLNIKNKNMTLRNKCINTSYINKDVPYMIYGEWKTEYKIISKDKDKTIDICLNCPMVSCISPEGCIRLKGIDRKIYER